MRTAGKLIRTSSLIIAILSVFFISSSQPVMAHVLKQDHGISGVLHIPPEDNPQAGETVRLNVAFADKKNSFSLANCDCRAVIKLNGKTMQTVPLRPYFSGSTLNSTSTVTFPAIAVYDVALLGTSRNNSFPAFQLNYLVRVATSATSPAAASDTTKGASVIIIAAGSLAILALFAYVAIASGPRYKKKPQPQPTKNAKRR